MDLLQFLLHFFYLVFCLKTLIDVAVVVETVRQRCALLFFYFISASIVYVECDRINLLISLRSPITQNRTTLHIRAHTYFGNGGTIRDNDFHPDDFVYGLALSNSMAIISLKNYLIGCFPRLIEIFANVTKNGQCRRHHIILLMQSEKSFPQKSIWRSTRKCRIYYDGLFLWLQKYGKKI